MFTFLFSFLLDALALVWLDDVVNWVVGVNIKTLTQLLTLTQRIL